MFTYTHAATLMRYFRRVFSIILNCEPRMVAHDYNTSSWQAAEKHSRVPGSLDYTISSRLSKATY